MLRRSWSNFPATATYKPVTEHVRVGENTDPEAKQVPEKHIGHLPVPKDDDYSMFQ